MIVIWALYFFPRYLSVCVVRGQGRKSMFFQKIISFSSKNINRGHGGWSERINLGYMYSLFKSLICSVIRKISFKYLMRTHNQVFLQFLSLYQIDRLGPGTVEFSGLIMYSFRRICWVFPAEKESKTVKELEFLWKCIIE